MKTVKIKRTLSVITSLLNIRIYIQKENNENKKKPL